VLTSTVTLWICIGLFFARVVGQLEVLLLAPDWLPPMHAWTSGLLPYPVLLPLQIALLMSMSIAAFQERTARPAEGAKSRTAKLLRLLAGVYFLTMAIRLCIVVRVFGSDYYLHGAIPVAFHWVLALFLLVWTRGQPGARTVTVPTSGRYPVILSEGGKLDDRADQGCVAGRDRSAQ
jgi:hypothetical protein